ncbi:hypothetical protein [Streptomyces sp. NPDC018045]|uniref:hypothetical protein n=1 Tax=Streptomyces sp. NPDC018045 TaxID=3365037 RepID=UPI003798EBA8
MTQPTDPARTDLPQLPPPLRVLTWPQYEAAYARLTAAAHRYRLQLPGAAAAEMVTDALSAAGVFPPAPAPEPDTCGALYLPHDPQSQGFEPELLGEWQQCAGEPGHGGRHDNGEFIWDDGMPGAVPARAQAEARP